MTDALLGAFLAGGPLMLWGLGCGALTVAYMAVMTFGGWDSRHGDTLMVITGVVGGVLMIAGIVALHP
jgi:hypothetical protein